ncbi:hypothetical protein B0I35DRAFT_473872 [Stachybotrys elegans]|uniref:Uncharacterized protein n=1 Tax=Stachybotrys elegans TaxID=80388 RepID=A0A8K0T310_9HYPO|nr:hypothetical protein B0I35DRAFT_473872 [Stachybotrys elegans]
MILYAILLLMASATAIVLPQGDEPAEPQHQALTTATAYTVTAACGNEICDGTTSWCFYWAGVTGYDRSLGPIPGVTRRPLGPCGPDAPQPTAVDATLNEILQV